MRPAAATLVLSSALGNRCVHGQGDAAWATLEVSDTSPLTRGAGYGAPDILGRVVEATRAVVAGAAPFERDSIMFDEPEYPFAVLALFRLF